MAINRVIIAAISSKDLKMAEKILRLEAYLLLLYNPLDVYHISCNLEILKVIVDTSLGSV